MTVSSEKMENSLIQEKEKSEEKVSILTRPETFQTVNLSITIIIPVHNEEKRLLKSIERMIEYCNSQLWDYELVVVEDGSTDRTVELIQDLISKYSRLKLITNKQRLGKGKAIKHGIFAAEKKYIGYMDADLSADPSELKRLLLFIDQFDIVIGSRILRGELPPIRRPFSRSFLSHSYSRLFRAMFRNVPVYDPQCGLKLFKSHVAHTLLSQTETNGFAFDCEVLVKASRLGLTIKEVPIIWKHCYGSTVSMLHEIVIMGKDLMSVWYRTKVSKSL
jgi:glycosyltransferase involved in cell wall biosynthesis